MPLKPHLDPLKSSVLFVDFSLSSLSIHMSHDFLQFHLKTSTIQDLYIHFIVNASCLIVRKEATKVPQKKKNKIMNDNEGMLMGLIYELKACIYMECDTKWPSHGAFLELEAKKSSQSFSEMNNCGDERRWNGMSREGSLILKVLYRAIFSWLLLKIIIVVTVSCSNK